MTTNGTETTVKKPRSQKRQRATSIRLRATAYEVDLVRQYSEERHITTSELIRELLVKEGALPPIALAKPVHPPKGTPIQNEG